MSRIAFLLFLLLVAGCTESGPADRKGGVDVNVDKKDGVKVRAPGVDVDVNRK
jgi:hypothetical protein